MEHILTTICGFLNADGGILYIGVNDIGYPRGIETDLNYLRCNEDKYQLLIRKYIVKDLGKDINSLILIDFHSFNEKTVCAVSVPSYHQAVSYKGIVWQRQGNSTRPLDTPEIRLLKERRSALILSKKNTETPFKELENTSADQADNIFPVNIPTYKLPVESAHPLPQTEVPPIYTSVLKTNKEQEAIAFFSILESGKFMLSKEFPYQHNTRIALPLYDEYLSGYLLYDDYGLEDRIGWLAVKKEIALDGRHIKSAEVGSSNLTNRPEVDFVLDGDGAVIFGEFTSAHGREIGRASCRERV